MPERYRHPMRHTAITLMCLVQAIIIVVSWLFVSGCLNDLEDAYAYDGICGDRLESSAYFWLCCVRRYELALIILPLSLGIIWYCAARWKASNGFPAQKFFRLTVIATLDVGLSGYLLMVEAEHMIP